MSAAGTIRIDRLIIDGRALSAAQARELAGRIAAELAPELTGDVEAGARERAVASLAITLEGAGGLGLAELARSVAWALKRELE